MNARTWEFTLEARTWFPNHFVSTYNFLFSPHLTAVWQKFLTAFLACCLTHDSPSLGPNTTHFVALMWSYACCRGLQTAGQPALTTYLFRYRAQTDWAALTELVAGVRPPSMFIDLKETPSRQWHYERGAEELPEGTKTRLLCNATPHQERF